MESEKLIRRSLTPCLDENRVEDDNCADDSKEIELSDISDDDEQWLECNNKAGDGTRPNGNANGSSDHHHQSKESAFKKITKNNRERNYRDRDNARRRSDDFRHQKRSNYNKFDNSRKKEIERYDVRKVIASREFSMSRSKSRSRSYSPRKSIFENTTSSQKISQKRDSFRQSISPAAATPLALRSRPRYSPISMSPPSHSLSPVDRFRSYPYNKRSQSPQEETNRRSRSRHKHTKNSKILKISIEISLI